MLPIAWRAIVIEIGWSGRCFESIRMHAMAVTSSLVNGRPRNEVSFPKYLAAADSFPVNPSTTQLQYAARES
ncbi:MAG: hypothetical protein CBE00_04905 [Planctomycetaceae bacterium TMED240]|nr:hypothetical protein [Rhodopirellula sp.]OUX07558.1 MAG: hypothetical protein CBE00_04905 [Planctomycetaceae bacterium TMED240]